MASRCIRVFPVPMAHATIRFPSVISPGKSNPAHLIRGSGPRARDDRKGRAEAERCGLRVTGTISLLEAAAGRGFPTTARLHALETVRIVHRAGVRELDQPAYRRVGAHVLPLRQVCGRLNDV